MDDSYILIALIILIASTLQIILFFKIWKMTNDTAEIRKTLNIILYRKLTIEKRKEELIDNVFKKFDKEGLVTQSESKDNIDEWVANGINLYEEYIQELFEMYDITDVYSVEELKRDVAKRFS